MAAVLPAPFFILHNDLKLASFSKFSKSYLGVELLTQFIAWPPGNFKSTVKQLLRIVFHVSHTTQQ
jgi:hypothetical protein